MFSQRDETQLSRLVKLNRRKSLQDLTKLISEGKPNFFWSKTVQLKLSNLGYKRRAVKKKVVVREVNKKKTSFVVSLKKRLEFR